MLLLLQSLGREWDFETYVEYEAWIDWVWLQLINDPRIPKFKWRRTWYVFVHL